MSWNEKVTKTENLRKCLVLYFVVWRKREKVCVLCSQLFAFSSVVLPQIHNLQTITPKSYNHTTFKPSYQNHKKNIYILYVSKFDWFWYDYGMMVWKWYDWMTSVWWFVSCVFEGVQLKKMQTVVNKVHTLFLVFFKLRNTTQSTSLTFRFL